MAKSSGKVTGKRLSSAAKASRIVQPNVAKSARRDGVIRSTSRQITSASTTGTTTRAKQ